MVMIHRTEEQIFVEKKYFDQQQPGKKQSSNHTVHKGNEI